MRHTKLLSACLALAVSGTSAYAWTKLGSPEQPPKGPYKVVTSKPLGSRGYRVGTLYTENEDLTEMLNQLDKEGLRPIFSDVVTWRGINENTVDDVRLLMICVDK